MCGADTFQSKFDEMKKNRASTKLTQRRKFQREEEQTVEERESSRHSLNMEAHRTHGETDNADGGDRDEDDVDEGGEDFNDEFANDDVKDVGDDEDDNELDLIHDRLISAIDKYAKTPDRAKVEKKRSQYNAESIHGSHVTDATVSMNALLGALDNFGSLKGVNQLLTDLEKNISAPTFVEKVVSERVERGLTYSNTKKEMDKWQELVTQNKHTKTLDLAMDKRQMPSYKNLVKTFEPTTDLEKDIKMVLIKTNATDEGAAAQEESDLLRGSGMTVQELREKQAELAKVKALMFYEQLKRHRLNKIKSKAYHRIRNKQKSRRGDKGGEEIPDDEEDANDKEDDVTKRIQERMDLRHKNTGKWAKMAIQHGRADKSLRKAYQDSVLLGQELSKRIESDPVVLARDSDADESDDEAAGSSISGSAAKKFQRVLSDSAEAVQAETEAMTGKYSKLLDMDFMKRAAQSQKDRAREEAQSVLRELRQLEEEGDDDEQEGAEDTTESPSLAQIQLQERESASARSEMATIFTLPSGSSQNGGLHNPGNESFGGLRMPVKVKSVSFAAPVLGDTTIGTAIRLVRSTQGTATAPADDERGDETEKVALEVIAVANPWLQPAVVSEIRDGVGKKIIKKKNNNDELYISVDHALDATMAEGGGKSVGSETSTGKNPPKKRKMNSSSGDVMSNATMSNATMSNATTSNATGSQQVPASSNGFSASSTSAPYTALTAPNGRNDGRKPLLLQKSQADLVHMAFAGPAFEDDFKKMKQDAVDDELGLDQRKLKILSEVKAGWGDWAGPGESGISKRTLDKRDRLMKKASDGADEKRKTRKDVKMFNVMVSEKRVKSASKYMIANIPHPFTSREEYERSIQMPVGAEWNASHVVRANTKPEILLRAGRLIEPIHLPKKRTAGSDGPNSNHFPQRQVKYTRN